MKQRVVGFIVALTFACGLSTPAFAQGTASISGTVVDSGGGAMPGVTIVVTSAAGEKFETVTNTQGVFSVPALTAGTYTISASLTGFKSAKIPDVRIQPGTPNSVKVVMEVGQLEETITVQSSAELINTQTPTVSSTLNADQINRMPTPTRNAINAVTFLPGINTATTNRESRINGLPESFVSITMDGVSNNDNFLRSSDSFFASVYPRQDAIEAVTVTTAAAPSSVGGSGAVTINFATRSGTNRFTGSAYEYWRTPPPPRRLDSPGATARPRNSNSRLPSPNSQKTSKPQLPRMSKPQPPISVSVRNWELEVGSSVGSLGVGSWELTRSSPVT